MRRLGALWAIGLSACAEPAPIAAPSHAPLPPKLGFVEPAPAEPSPSGESPTPRASASVTDEDEGPGARLNEPAPPLSARYLDGKGPHDVFGGNGHATIVEFWATWALPARRSLPAYQDLVAADPERVAAIGVAVDSPEEIVDTTIVSFAKEAGVRFTILWDSEQRSAKRYRPPKLPTTYLIDKKGIVRFIHAGFSESDLGDIASEVARLAAEP
jgi:thiol-disulfide isomerase/thioredoxin